MKHFNWMVFSRVSIQGIHFYGTQTHIDYIFYWNPMRNIFAWLNNNYSFGWFPLYKSHIKF